MKDVPSLYYMIALTVLSMVPVAFFMIRECRKSPNFSLLAILAMVFPFALIAKKAEYGFAGSLIDVTLCPFCAVLVGCGFWWHLRFRFEKIRPNLFDIRPLMALAGLVAALVGLIGTRAEWLNFLSVSLGLLLAWFLLACARVATVVTTEAPKTPKMAPLGPDHPAFRGNPPLLD